MKPRDYTDFHKIITTEAQSHKGTQRKNSVSSEPPWLCGILFLSC